MPTVSKTALDVLSKRSSSESSHVSGGSKQVRLQSRVSVEEESDGTRPSCENLNDSLFHNWRVLRSKGHHSSSAQDQHYPRNQGGHQQTGSTPVIKGAQQGSGYPALNISQDRLSSDGRESYHGQDSPNTLLPQTRSHDHHKMKKRSVRTVLNKMMEATDSAVTPTFTSKADDHATMLKVVKETRMLYADQGWCAGTCEAAFWSVWTNKKQELKRILTNQKDIHRGQAKNNKRKTTGPGVSEQEQGALAKLPGPGKFKQMTRQHGTDDVDSGFIGSDVSQLNSGQQQQQQQHSLRLRHTSGDSRAGPRSIAGRESDQSRSQKDGKSDSKETIMQNDTMDVTGSLMDDYTETEFSESDRAETGRRKRGQSMSSHDGTLKGYSEEDDTDTVPKAVDRKKMNPKVEIKKQLPPVKGQRKPRTTVLEERRETSPRATPRYTSSSDAESVTGLRRQDQTLPTKSRIIKTEANGRQIHGQENSPREAKQDIAVGSDREWDRSHESDVTRGSSVTSSRLKELQEEVERLKERVEHTEEQVPLSLPPLPRDQPEYYDPFDDPYGFMRMPRRRANSFSGAPTREWDEWYWTLPQQRLQDDIPLGYAAADAFAELPLQAAAEESSRRSRLKKPRMKKTEQIQAPGTAPAESPQAFTNYGQTGPVPGAHPGAHISVEAVSHKTNPETLPSAEMNSSAPCQRPKRADAIGLHKYYIPSRYSTQAMRQQLASKGYFQTPSGAKIYASHPDAAQGYPALGSHFVSQKGLVTSGGPVPQGYQSDTVTGSRSSPANRQPFYSIRQSSNKMKTPQGPRTKLHSGDGWSGYQTDLGFGAGELLQRQRSYLVETQSCPLCGDSGQHTHLDEGGDVQQYSEEYFTGRSRSLPRSKKKAQKYRRFHGYHSDENLDLVDSAAADLDESLILSEGIGRLTKKMLRLMDGELQNSKRREYGSSYW